jgi:hypothetical protein
LGRVRGSVVRLNEWLTLEVIRDGYPTNPPGGIRWDPLGDFPNRSDFERSCGRGFEAGACSDPARAAISALFRDWLGKAA